MQLFKYLRMRKLEIALFLLPDGLESPARKRSSRMHFPKASAEKTLSARPEATFTFRPCLGLFKSMRLFLGHST